MPFTNTYTIRREQQLPVDKDRAWQFFSDPHNLALITPAAMRFEVKNDPPRGHIYPGMIIEYRLRPVLNIPMYWMTEITHVDPGHSFIDEQRFGPYSLWHHQHLFEPLPNGQTLMKDIVHYRLPLGPLGTLAHSLFVRKQLMDIFYYREKVTPGLLAR